MNHNQFYGKDFTELNADELMLLSIDLQITAIQKKGGDVLCDLAIGYNVRVKASNECLKYGGDYSREKFETDNNIHNEGFTKEEIKEEQKNIDEFTKMMKKMRDKIMKKDSKDELVPLPLNGRMEVGFQMN